MKKIIFAFAVAMICSCTTTPVAPTTTEENDSTKVDTTEVVNEVVNEVVDTIIVEE